MKEMITYILNQKIYLSIIVVVAIYSTYLIIMKLISKYISKIDTDNKKRKTYLKLIKNIIKYVVIAIIIVTVLQINGVNVASLVAGLGLVSVIAGLALQDALKDIITGFNILMDEYFSVGDVIKIGDIEGKVIEIGLKATKVKNIKTENILVIANRNVSQAEKISHQIDIDIRLPYDEKKEIISKVIEEIIIKIKNDKRIESVEYKGIEKFDESSIIHKIRLQAVPDERYQIIREANVKIKDILDENSIEIPFNQLDIHKK